MLPKPGYAGCVQPVAGRAHLLSRIPEVLRLQRRGGHSEQNVDSSVAQSCFLCL